VFVVYVEMERKESERTYEPSFSTGPPQNEGEQTDILIRLHASLEV